MQGNTFTANESLLDSEPGAVWVTLKYRIRLLASAACRTWKSRQQEKQYQHTIVGLDDHLLRDIGVDRPAVNCKRRGNSQALTDYRL